MALTQNNERDFLYEYYTRVKGYSPAGAAGILANFNGESDNTANKYNNDASKDYNQTSQEHADYLDTPEIDEKARNEQKIQNGAYGLGQEIYKSNQPEDPDTRKRIVQYTHDAGKSVADLQTQADYFDYRIEQNNKNAQQRVKTATDPYKAALEYNTWGEQGGDEGIPIHTPMARPFYQYYADTEGGYKNKYTFPIDVPYAESEWRGYMSPQGQSDPQYRWESGATPNPTVTPEAPKVPIQQSVLFKRAYSKLEPMYRGQQIARSSQTVGVKNHTSPEIIQRITQVQDEYRRNSQ